MFFQDSCNRKYSDKNYVAGIEADSFVLLETVVLAIVVEVSVDQHGVFQRYPIPMVRWQ
jgi:hypothetical protein